MKRSGGVWIVVVGVVAVGGAVLATGGGRFFGREERAAVEGVTARRGKLLISEVVRGNLMAKNSLTLRNELEGRTTILSLVDEGTWVEPGDVIAELDTAGLADELVMQKIAERNAAADYTKAREQLAIQEIQNASDIAQAKLDLTFAEMDLEKYTIDDGEWTHELKQAEETIKLAEEELKRGESNLEWTRKLYEQGFAQGLELEADQAAVDRASVELEQAKRDKALKEQYGHRRKLEELKAAVETMGREVEKVEKQATARLADFQAGEESAKIEWDLEKEKLKKIEEQLQKGKIIAPIRGMVVYARENSRWGSSEPVQEGKEVREREEIVSIPREDGMIVEASLHETVLEKVQIGQRCKIVVEAIRSTSFDGRVDFVAVLADSNAWFANPNQRVYRSEISIESPVPEMRPGMSCSVEILVAELDDVVYVPVQCVFFDAGRTIAFVRKDGATVRRDVEVGLDNSKFVEIKSGIEEGEIVLLSAPPGFKPAPAPDAPRDDEEDELVPPGEGGPPSGPMDMEGMRERIRDGAGGFEGMGAPQARGEDGERRRREFAGGDDAGGADDERGPRGSERTPGEWGRDRPGGGERSAPDGAAFRGRRDDSRGADEDGGDAGGASEQGVNADAATSESSEAVQEESGSEDAR